MVRILGYLAILPEPMSLDYREVGVCVCVCACVHACVCRHKYCPTPDNPRYVEANAGCKHFDVHGGPEDIPVSRFSFDAKVSEQDWRMTFLPQFKACVEAGSWSLMCSYNSINGVPACANKELLTDILRDEWGFQGKYALRLIGYYIIF